MQTSDTELNEGQEAAVLAPDGPVLVLAAAGTGKTRTLVHRVAHLVARGIPADRLLLLTFTNRAATEMLERARHLAGAGVSGLWGGTFHHLANRLLRRHAGLLGYPADYTILDRDDAKSLVGTLVKETGATAADLPRASVLLSLFSAAANREQPVREAAEARFSSLLADPGVVVRVHDLYTQRKQAMGAMDFDDLLVQSLRLLREHAGVQDLYRDRFLHILVDEYQDTNCLQAELVDRLGSRHRNVFAVGDDFQSIYGWRGADFRNIMSFPRRYGNCTVRKLELNYRSTPEILDVANACIAGNPEQFQKTLRSTRAPGGRPVLAVLYDGGAQARYVVNAIYRFRRQGYALHDIAVLYRAHFHAMELQMELARSELPYAITSGIRYFEQAHVKDVVSLLRLLANPADRLAFERLFGMLPGVGPRTVARLWARVGECCACADPAVRAQLAGGLPAKARVAWAGLDRLLGAYHDENLGARPDEVIHRFLRCFYQDYAARAFDDPENRLDDAQELARYAASFPSLEGFLTEVALATNVDAEPEAGEAPVEAVHLSTVHQAKGLEWPVVILLWVNEGMFPSQRALDEVGHDAEEERRLFYVAVTRAKDALCLCVPRCRRTREGGMMSYEPSRFVTEIPSSLFTVRNEGYM